MFALYEEAGRFHAGRLMSETDAAAQVELASGKRAKVKQAALLLRFAAPEPEALLREAGELAATVDLDLAWEFAPDAEFAYGELADDYFGSAGSATTTVQQAAALLALFGAPHYFRRLGKGRFRKAPEETVKAALAGIEKKKRIAEQVSAWAVDLVEGRCPLAVRDELYRILFKPDKNAPAYKAVVEAARQSGRAPLELLKAAGAIDSPYQFHWRRFLFEQFPKGTAFPPLAAPAVDASLPLATVQAFSIDDSETTEIDDALSLQNLGGPVVTLGIHIAAPALAIAPDGEVDKVARDRLSTVYMPGHKLTMLPGSVVEAYTLAEGTSPPAVSLYVDVDATTYAVTNPRTVIERVPIVANLRHDRLEDDAADAAFAAGAVPDLPHGAELAFLHRLALALKAGREQVRGKPESFGRPDYAFRILRDDARADHPAGPIAGDETVEITTRRRGSPLDLVVAEAMILANRTWGAWLAECGVPGIYRAQASLAPGVKVRMGTRALPHAGLGVPCYAWSTSPLRRYVDLVNQWQIIACARHGRTAALAAPFKPRDVRLMAVVADFDATYGEYNRFQSAIERYWSLQWLRQHEVRELDATTMVNGLVRADTLPLVFAAAGTEGLPRGERVRVAIAGIDLLTLDLHARLVGRLQAGAGATPGDPEADAEAEEEAAASGPLTIAVDVEPTAEGADVVSDTAPAVAG